MKIEAVIFFIIIVLIVLFNSNGVYASLGLTPAITRVDFNPNDKFLINYNVVAVSPDQKLEIYASGDLAKYVRFDKTTLKGEGAFTAYVDLPGEIEKPGQHVIYIRVREVRDASYGIGTKLEIGAAFVVKVPYPGKYIEIKSFFVNDTNSGDPVVFSSEIENLGNEDLFLGPVIEVYSDKRLINNFTLEKKLVNHTTSEVFTQIVESGYDAGTYNTTISFDYGKVVSKKTDFKVGTLFVDIVNWSSQFIIGKISEFNIGVESKWNNDLKDVYAEVNVTKNGVQVDFFKTPSAYLNRWEKLVLKGFFNTENLEKGTYKANLFLFYEDKTTEKIGDIKVSNASLSKLVVISIFVGVFFFLTLIGIIIYLILNKRVLKKSKK